MAQQPPQLPPPNEMIRLLTTPNHADGFYRELVERNSPRFQELSPIKRGSLYSECKGGDERVNAAFPNLYFCSETVPIGSNTVAGMQQHEFVIWNWSSNVIAESSYNAEVTYLGESITNPVYARQYIIRRDEYDASPTLPVGAGTPLTSLLGVKKINGGNGYTKTETTFLGAGSGASIEWVIGDDGEIVSGIVTAEGTGFDSTSTIQIIGDGSFAEYQLIIQPPEAVLTSQRKLELGDGDPLQPEFVKVLRVWEVLPGPWLPFTRYDDDLGPIQGRQRAVLNTGQRGGIHGPTSYLNYNAREGSSIVSMELEERFSDGTGSDDDNPTYPILRWSTYEPEKGTVDHTSQLVPFNQFSEQASWQRTVFNNRYVVTKTWFEPYPDNPGNLAKKLTDIWTDILIQDFKISSEFGGGFIEIDEQRGEPGTLPLNPGYLATESAVKTLSPNEQVRHNEFLYGQSEWPVLQGAHTDEKTGIVLKFSKQVIPAYTPVPVRNGYRGPFVEDQPYDFWKTIRIITTPDCSTLPGAEAWWTTRPFSLPPLLLSIEAIWSDEVSYSAEAHSSNVRVQISSGSRGGLIVTSRNGYRGYARTLIARDYKCGPFTDTDQYIPLTILPSSGSIVFFETESHKAANGIDGDTTISGTSSGNAFSDAGGLASESFEQRVHEIDIRDHLIGPLNTNVFSLRFGDVQLIGATHNRLPATARSQSAGGTVRNIGLAGGFNTAWGARIEVNLPQSTPSPWDLARQPSRQILTEVEVEEWGYGIWVRHRYYTDLTGIFG